MMIAPWLKAPDLAADWLHGVALGQQAAQASQRLQVEQSRAAMEAQARSETLQQRTLEEQQRIAVSKAYQQSEIGLQQQRLQEIQQVNTEKTRAAAMKLHQQTTFNKVYQDTGDVQKALFASGMGTPSNVLAARKDVEDLGAQRLAQRQQALELRENEYQDKLNKKPVPRRIGEKSVTDLITGDKTTTYQFEQPDVARQSGTRQRCKTKIQMGCGQSRSGASTGAPAVDVDQSDE